MLQQKDGGSLKGHGEQDFEGGWCEQTLQGWEDMEGERGAGKDP